MKNLIFTLILPVIAFAQNETDLPDVSTPRETSRAPTPANIQPSNSSQQNTPSTGSSSFFRTAVSEHEYDAAPIPPPFQQEYRFPEHNDAISQLLQNIGSALNPEGQDIISLVVNINELALYHGYFPEETQSQLLRQILSESNPYRRMLAITNFLNTIFSRIGPIQASINSQNFQLRIWQEHHMLENIEHQLRELEQNEQVDFQAFWDVAYQAIPRSGYISDQSERNLLHAISHETRPIIWQGLFISWLESRYVVRDVIEAFRTNLRAYIQTQQRENSGNIVALRTLAAEAREVGFEDLALEIETSARWTEALQETVRRGPSLIIRSASGSI